MRDAVDKLALPDISALKQDELKEYLEVIRQRLNSYIEELKEYEKELNKKILEVVLLPKIKDAANRIFYKYPEANYIAIIERVCGDDDSGNCSWSDRELTHLMLPDLDFKGIEYSWDSDTQADFNDLRRLFIEAYPDLTFEDGANASWDDRADAYYGLNRDFKPVFISEYDEDEGYDSDPIFEEINTEE